MKKIPTQAEIQIEAENEVNKFKSVINELKRDFLYK